jgi:oligoribonuclease NrnB/cAMP/cGMP phosphodiesterase (DHH superfamily)
VKPKKILAPKKKTLGAKKLTAAPSSPTKKKDDMRIESFDHMEKRAAKEAAEKEDHDVRYDTIRYMICALLYAYLITCRLNAVKFRSRFHYHFNV